MYFRRQGWVLKVPISYTAAMVFSALRLVAFLLLLQISRSAELDKSLVLNETNGLKASVVPKVLSLLDGDSVLTSPGGTSYSLAVLHPDTSLYPDKYFAVKDSSHTYVVDKRTGESVPVSIFRALYEDGATIIAEKDDDGVIVYAELRYSIGTPTLFLVRDARHPGKLVSFVENEMRAEPTTSWFQFGPDLEVPLHRRHLDNPGGSSANPSDIGAIVDCPFFKVVHIAIVFDGEFCAMHGSFETARRAIKMTVASASLYYERCMCVKLKLSGTYTPESLCERDGYFGTYNRDVPCGNPKETFLQQFTLWARDYRSAEGVDPDATIHLFSGYQPKSGTVGCAWIGSTCIQPYAYAVEFLSGLSRRSQEIVFAHELAHNLNARHLPPSDDSDYIMEPFLGSGLHGFSSTTVNAVQQFLDRPSVSCTSIERPTTLSPSEMPSEIPRTQSPSSPPTQFPWNHPTRSTSSPPISRGTVVSNDDACSVTQGWIDPVCTLASNRRRYACFDRISLLEIGPSNSKACTMESMVLHLLSCEDVEYDNDLPSIMFRQPNKQSRKPAHEKSPAGGDIDKFIVNQCGTKCIEADSYVCVLAETNDPGTVRAYNVTYSVSVSSGAATAFSAVVLVLHDGDTGSEQCVSEHAKCKNRKSKMLRG